MTEKQLTPEQKKLLKEEAEKNGLSEKEIKDVEELVNIAGGMSEPMKRTIIGVSSALGGAALGAGLIFAVDKYRNKHKTDSSTSTPTPTSTPKKERLAQDYPSLTPEEIALFSEEPEAMKQFSERKN